MDEFRKMLSSDLEIVFRDGTSVLFENTETKEKITLPSLAARVTQHYNPLTGATEALPLHVITVEKKAFTISIPTDLSKLRATWTALAGEKIEASIKEERPTNSMGMITFLCQSTLKDEKDEEWG